MDEICERCGCWPGVAGYCDCPEKCSCHWGALDRAKMAADELLADKKEEGI